MVPLLGSGLESRFWGELCHAMARVKRDFANDLADEMLSRYEHRITKESDGGPIGHTFKEIYDLKTLTPRRKFLRVYKKAKWDLEDRSLEFRH